jgi:hypothetical protein
MIDNVKAKIQDKEEKRSWSRPTLARRPVFGQLAASPTSFPLEEPLGQVSASHDKSRPREVSASHEKSGPDWYVGPDARHEPCHGRAWRNESQQLPAMQVACPGKSLNAGLTSCAVITSHHLPLCHMQAQPEALKHPLQHAQA